MVKARPPRHGCVVGNSVVCILIGGVLFVSSRGERWPLYEQVYTNNVMYIVHLAIWNYAMLYNYSQYVSFHFSNKGRIGCLDITEHLHIYLVENYIFVILLLLLLLLLLA